MTNSKSFYRYMTWHYKTYDTRFGDLARDMIADKSFPRNIKNKQDEYTVIRQYLESKNAVSNAIDTFVDAYHEYLKNRD
jgi:uncharacterized protein YozE (UPF0346 family)